MEAPTISIPKLPDDVVFLILAWVPVKPLLKFRCVCKSWLSLISTQHFIKAHLLNSQNDPNLTHRSIIFDYFGSDLKQLSISSLLLEPIPDDALDPDILPCFPRFVKTVMGSCDGLILYSTRLHNVFLWNPSTRTINKLPAYLLRKDSVNNYRADNLGYGFGKTSDDYKVVVVFDWYGSKEVITRIYSLKRDECRIIKSSWPLYNRGIHAHGKLHWVEFSESFLSVLKWDVVFLDLETEEFRRLAIPDCDRIGLYPMLSASRGRLYVLCSWKGSGEVWVMNDYGDGKENWIKVISISFADDDVFRDPSHITAFYVMKDGEVLLLCDSKLVVFDAKDRCVRYIGNLERFTKAIDYVESLVSPVGPW